MTIQRPEVTSCNFTVPIATFGALSNCSEVLLHPNCCTLIAPRLLKSALANLPASWPKTIEIGPGSLLPDADTIDFDDEQLPAVMVHRGVLLQIRGQSGDEFRKNFCVIVHLQRDNSFVVLGWIVDDMGEVAVQGQQNGVNFLGLRNNDPVSDDSTGKTSFNRRTS